MNGASHDQELQPHRNYSDNCKSIVVSAAGNECGVSGSATMSVSVALEMVGMMLLVRLREKGHWWCVVVRTNDGQRQPRGSTDLWDQRAKEEAELHSSI